MEGNCLCAKTDQAIKHYQDVTLGNVTQNDTAINLTLIPALSLQLKKGITSIIILSSGSAQILVRRVHSCILIDNQSGKCGTMEVYACFWSRLGQLFCLFVLFPDRCHGWVKCGFLMFWLFSGFVSLTEEFLTTSQEAKMEILLSTTLQKSSC